MKLEQQVISLDIAKRLKELGVKQESCFYWCEWEFAEGCDLRPSQAVFGQEILLGHSYKSEISAFTVAELGEMLPEQKIYTLYRHYKWQIDIPENRFIADTEADARGKMLIYLLENKLITL